MIMLLENDVIQFEPSKQTMRVLWIHSEKDTVFLIDIYDTAGLPIERPLTDIVSMITDKQAYLIDDPYHEVRLEDQISDASKKVRNTSIAIIGPFITIRPAIFYSDKRWKIVSVIETVSTPTIYKMIRRYWQRGQTANALLPDYKNSGAKGKSRQAGEVKRGRPRKYSLIEGVNVSAEMRKTFRVAVMRFYSKQKKHSLMSCYDQMLKEFFCSKIINPTNGSITIIPNEGESTCKMPTFAQFKYWVDKDNCRFDLKRSRVSGRVYDKDMRGLIGTSNTGVWGPGSKYQIDATVADVYLVSRIDRTKIIGRPVIYVVIDVFSRMIVGLYIGLEGPSWVAAMMALVNTVEDKQAFCKRFGIDIEPHDWPCHFLCATLLGDRGEIASQLINNLINNFNVQVESAAPFRADWKGIVEQRFNILPAKFKPYVDGYIETDFKERGGEDYRLHATLDTDQFTAIIIQCALYFNNHHEIKNYDKDLALSAANFASVPLDIWNWGIKNKSGALRQYPVDKVKFSLMPTADARITELGIQLKSAHYSCQKAIEERWFDRARQMGRKTVKVSYDPRNMDVIYLHDSHNKDGFVICNLTDRSRAFVGKSSWEINHANHISKVTSAEHAPKQKMAGLNLIANVEAVVDQSKRMKPSTKGVSAVSRTKSIRVNHAAEKLANRIKETFSLGEASLNFPDIPPNNVVKFPVGQDDDYSEPDITQIINSGKEDVDAN